VAKKPGLSEFAEQLKSEEKRCYLDSIPEEIQEQLITADVSVEIARKWLRSIGYEATGLDSWRRNKRVERGIQFG
jgi:signal recognition particle GTPase